MLSDDEIWSRWKFPTDLSWKQSVIALARAIEREARQQALEDAAQACVAIERRKWLAIRDGGVIDSGPLACYSAIRALKEETK